MSLKEINQITVKGKTSNKITKKITFKKKQFAEDGSILSQEDINCDVLEMPKNY